MMQGYLLRIEYSPNCHLRDQLSTKEGNAHFLFIIRSLSSSSGGGYRAMLIWKVFVDDKVKTVGGDFSFVLFLSTRSSGKTTIYF